MVDNSAAIPVGLKRIVADSFILGLLVQIASWRLEPGARNGLAIVLSQLVDFLNDTAMETAIRTRVLGETPPDVIEELVQLSSCRPPVRGEPAGGLSGIVQATVLVAQDFHIMGQIARESRDEATAQFLFTRTKTLEEYAWSIGQFASGLEDSGL
jgi:DNA-binding ferritin-like protein